jgi:Reverse transcriptase (RNA-dependent DNA polymerase)/Endonuclease-reverse transcriptase
LNLCPNNKFTYFIKSSLSGMLVNTFLFPLVVGVLLRRSLAFEGTQVDDVLGSAAPGGGTNWAIVSTLSAVTPAAVRPPLMTSRRYVRRANALAVLLLIGGVERNPGPASGPRCGLLNVRYATNKAALIHDTIDTQGLDILAMVETNISHDAPAAIRDDIAPDGFRCLHAPRVGRKKKTGGGIAMVYRNNLKVEVMKPPSQPANFELLCAKVVSGCRRLNILVLYRPPPRATASFFDELSALIDFFDAEPGELIICGDFNCPGDIVGTVDSRLTDIISDAGYSQFVNTATRLDNLLDLVIAHADVRIIGTPSVTDISYSDHRLVSFDLNLPVTRVPRVTFSCRSMKKLDCTSFEHRVRSCKIFTAPPASVDDFVSLMNDNILQVLDDLVPASTRTKRVSAKPSAIWMTPGAISAKRTSRRLERRYHNSRTITNYTAYRKASRAAVSAIKSARAEHFKTSVTAAQGNPRAVWRVANQLLHSSTAQPVLDPSGAQSLADSFASFFSNKLSNIQDIIAKSLAISNSLPCSSTSPNTITTNPIFHPVTFAEALGLIESRHTSKSSPTDIVPSCLLKLCPTLFAELLCKIANLSFSQGVFPSTFKLAQITPLLKKPGLDPNLPASFRPISNLSTFSKLIERLALSRLRPHITSAHNFPISQSAYRPLHSTETAMLKISNDLLVSAGSGSAVSLVTLDLTAAFDTVNHAKLCDRLTHEFGIVGTARDWLSSYLSGRHQFVKVGSAISTTTACSAGVPQGSVLGPLLFSAYIGPVSRLIDSTGVRHHAYADDVTLYIQLGVDARTARSTLIDCAAAVGNWFLENDLLLNASKSEVIEFGTTAQLKKLPPAPAYVIAGVDIVPVDSVKILGITLDNKLSFDKQVSAICSACAFHTRALRHIRPLLDTDTANAIACSSVGSRLDYCNSLLAGISSHNIMRLQRAQNNAARAVCRASRRCSVTPLLRQLHWLPVAQRIDYKVALLTFKALSTNSPPYIRDLIVPYSPHRALRSSTENRLTVPMHNNKSALASRAFQNYAPKVWNALSSELRELGTPANIDPTVSVNCFKRRLKTELFNAAFSGA